MRYEDSEADYGDTVEVTRHDGSVYYGTVSDIELDYQDPENDRIILKTYMPIEFTYAEIASIRVIEKHVFPN